jgi:uncharacterized protein YdhG (YjbR/CyaY superfamily)
MVTDRKKTENIDDYIASFSPEVQSILEEIRRILKEEVPEAKEKISYQMPTLTLNGSNLIYFAAFKKHIGIYPPVNGDENLMEKLAPYLGEKGNLRFPLSEPIPVSLIRKVAKARVKEHQETLALKLSGK